MSFLFPRIRMMAKGQREFDINLKHDFQLLAKSKLYWIFIDFI